jgi:hypothetical protein
MLVRSERKMKARKVQLIDTHCHRLRRQSLRAIILRTEFVYVLNLHKISISETVILCKKVVYKTNIFSCSLRRY